MEPSSCPVEVQYYRHQDVQYFENLLASLRIFIKSANQFTHNSKVFIEFITKLET